MVSDEYFHIFIMKQMQFIDAYWGILLHNAPDCIQTCLTYMQIRATSYMGMRSASFMSQVETKIWLLSTLQMYWILLLVPVIVADQFHYQTG